MIEHRKPQTITGRGLAAFLKGLFPETDQFDRQIFWIEEEARTGLFWPGQSEEPPAGAREIVERSGT